MFTFTLHHEPKPLRRILCLGAHSDDIEIGCGGTLLKLIEQNPHLSIDWVVFSATAARAQEARASAQAFLSGVTEKQIMIHSFRDGFFPYEGAAIKNDFEELKQVSAPDLIFTHYRQDLHQDHRMINELTWNTFRDHLILEYEIPKYDGDLGNPNCFFHLDRVTCQRKVDYLLTYFQTQSNKHWFTGETFQAILRLRGIESKAPDLYAEAFYGRKLVF